MNDFVQLVVAKEIVSVILPFNDTDGAVVPFDNWFGLRLIAGFRRGGSNPGIAGRSASHRILVQL